MAMDSVRASAQSASPLRDLAPGVAVSAFVALIGFLAAPHVAQIAPIPGMLIALLVGMALNPSIAHSQAQPGMNFCVRKVLRWAVALLGLRVAFSDITALGAGTGALIVGSMIATIVAGFLFARWNRQTAGFGALAGVGTGVCGASAALAVSSVIPDYKGKDADVVFAVVAFNALATLCMLLYPPLCSLLGFSDRATGIMLGGTIHDVAQVAAAGYAVSVSIGNTAVIVKLFRVFLLLPIVLAIGVYFTRLGMQRGEARVPVPVFAIVFLLLCALNSLAPLSPSFMPVYAPVKAVLVELSNWGLLLAIGALGLGTSVQTIIGLGWRHMTTIIGTTLVVFISVTVGLLLMQVG